MNKLAEAAGRMYLHLRKFIFILTTQELESLKKAIDTELNDRIIKEKKNGS